MKHRIDKFLLDLLWTLALLLAASFWFSLRFGFNIFLRAHWRYLANIQTGADSVSLLFYLSIVFFAVIWPMGLYLISHPHRRIKIADVPPDNPRPIAVPTSATALSAPAYTSYDNKIVTPAKAGAASPAMSAPAPAPAVVRPPRLTIPLQSQNKTADAAPAVTATGVVAPAPGVPLASQIPRGGMAGARIAPNAQPSPPAANPMVVLQLSEMLRSAGFINKSAPRIGGLRPDIWAIGSDETLLIGIVCGADGAIRAAEGGTSIWKSDTAGEFASPVWKLTGAIERLRALFNETLDEEIKITIHGFVVVETGIITNRAEVQNVWDAFEIQVFDDASDFGEYVSAHPNRQLAASEQEDFDAYAEYLDTVAEYFNNQNG